MRIAQKQIVSKLPYYINENLVVTDPYHSCRKFSLDPQTLKKEFSFTISYPFSLDQCFERSFNPQNLHKLMAVGTIR